MTLLALIVLGGYYAIRGWRVPSGLGRDAAAPALGLVSAVAVLLAWLANPFLALLLVPIAHVWLLDARRERAFPGRRSRSGRSISLLPLAAVVGNVAGRLGLWDHARRGSSCSWSGTARSGSARCSRLHPRGLPGRGHRGRGSARRRQRALPLVWPGESPGALEARPVPAPNGDLDASPIAPAGRA